MLEKVCTLKCLSFSVINRAPGMIRFSVEINQPAGRWKLDKINNEMKLQKHIEPAWKAWGCKIWFT